MILRDQFRYALGHLLRLRKVSKVDQTTTNLECTNRAMVLMLDPYLRSQTLAQ